jgi:uncharacterized Fe-S cluster-containing radical SAM superfamily enzyme
MDFANILFAGPCNRSCPFCIGKQVPGRLSENNLAVFPPKNIDSFVDEVRRLKIRHIVLTGTNTDPQLYRYERELVLYLKSQLPGSDFSLHTNGALVLKKLAVVDLYDKICISFPTFHPNTYRLMMGSGRPPDLQRIASVVRPALKVSCIINEHNIAEIDDFLQTCHRIGVPRVVLRRLYGDRRPWNILQGVPIHRFYRDNPVYDYDGMEVTYWDFDSTTSTSLNLFSDGTLSSRYLLTEAPSQGSTPDSRTLSHVDGGALEWGPLRGRDGLQPKL